MGLLKAKRLSQASQFTSLKMWNNVSPLLQSCTLSLSNTQITNKSRRKCLRLLFSDLYLGLLFFSFLCVLPEQIGLYTRLYVDCKHVWTQTPIMCGLWLEPSRTTQRSVFSRPGQLHAVVSEAKWRDLYGRSVCVYQGQWFHIYKLESWSGICRWSVAQ